MRELYWGEVGGRFLCLVFSTEAGRRPEVTASAACQHPLLCIASLLRRSFAPSPPTFWQTALGDITKGGTLVGFFALVPLTDTLSDIHFCCVFFFYLFVQDAALRNALLSDDSTRLLKNQYRDAAPWGKKKQDQEMRGQGNV